MLYFLLIIVHLLLYFLYRVFDAVVVVIVKYRRRKPNEEDVHLRRPGEKLRWFQLTAFALTPGAPTQPCEIKRGTEIVLALRFLLVATSLGEQREGFKKTHTHNLNKTSLFFSPPPSIINPTRSARAPWILQKGGRRRTLGEGSWRREREWKQRVRLAPR